VENHKRQVLSRKDIVRSLYENFKKSSTAAVFFPAPNTVFQFPGFKELIHDISDQELEPKDFDKVMGELPAILAEWEQRKMDNLIPSIPHLDNTVVNKNKRDFLATCIFRCDNHACTSYNTAFRIDQAMSHECEISMHPIETKLVYSERGSAAAASVVTVLGFDVRTAVPALLDAFRTKVGCVSCIKWNDTKAEVAEWLQFVRIHLLHWYDHSLTNSTRFNIS
jgi:hypothetical protein